MASGLRPTIDSFAKVISSSVYVRRDNKWWSVLYQETPIK